MKKILIGSLLALFVTGFQTACTRNDDASIGTSSGANNDIEDRRYERSDTGVGGLSNTNSARSATDGVDDTTLGERRNEARDGDRED